MYIRSLLPVAVFILLFDSVSAQLSNVKATLDGANVIITYDLVSESTDDKYVVSVSSSQDYGRLLRDLIGEVGEGITPGFNKRIIWDAKKSLGNFSGELDFLVKAELIYRPIVFIKPVASASVKRKKSLSIQWRGGMSEQEYSVMLYKNNSPVRELGEVLGSQQSYLWSVPKDHAKGKGYQVRLVDQSNETLYAASGPIKIKPKTSGFVKFLLFSTIAAGGYYAYDTFLSEPPPNPGPETLPDPPPVPSKVFRLSLFIGF